MAELTRQLLVSPAEKRIEQVRQAERLHDEIDLQRNYPFDFVNYRITGYRSEADDATLVGEPLQADLRLMIDMLSRSVGMPRIKQEPIQTAHELAIQLGVSTKTIERWRKMGLRWRWVEPLSPGGRKQLVFSKLAAQQFVKGHVERVARAQRFTKLDDQSRSQLIAQARQIARQPGMSLFRTARTIARDSGRAIETIRQLLEQHDQRHPENKIFVDHVGPLNSRQKQIIARAHRMKVPVDKIASHFRRTRATIHRVLRERRAIALQRTRIDYVMSPIFARDDAEEVLLRPEPTTSGQRPAGLEAALAGLAEPIRAIYDRPTLPVDRQRTLIVQMHYLKYRASHLCGRLDRHSPSVSDMHKIESFLQQAATVRSRLVHAHLPHVLVAAHLHFSGGDDQMDAQLIDLLELGNRNLIAAVDTYDFTQRQSFVPYLNWTIKRSFARYPGGSRRGGEDLTPELMSQKIRQEALKAGIDLD